MCAALIVHVGGAHCACARRSLCSPHCMRTMAGGLLRNAQTLTPRRPRARAVRRVHSVSECRRQENQRPNTLSRAPLEAGATAVWPCVVQPCADTRSVRALMWSARSLSPKSQRIRSSVPCVGDRTARRQLKLVSTPDGGCLRCSTAFSRPRLRTMPHKALLGHAPPAQCPAQTAVLRNFVNAR
jgi:hypothetical protein